MAKKLAIEVIFILLCFHDALLGVPSLASLQIGFYESTCPMAEKIIRRTVSKAVDADNGIAASLIRMHFHDCFVRGCDASILLDDSTPGNRVEKQSPINDPSQRGYHVIDDARSRLEEHCPHTVSCADIIAFAARDSSFITGGIEYSVPAGRRDGTVSLEPEVRDNLPSPTFDALQLIGNFASKGLSVEDLVTLSGAHSIGVSHCSAFNHRLINFNATHQQDPSLNNHLATMLKTKCSNVSTTNDSEQIKIGDQLIDPVVPLDVVAPNSLDVKYYKNLIKGKGLLASDQALVSNPLTAMIVMNHAANPSQWKEDFAAAMVRMGNIGVLTGSQGEIRNNCRRING